MGDLSNTWGMFEILVCLGVCYGLIHVVEGAKGGGSSSKTTDYTSSDNLESGKCDVIFNVLTLRVLVPVMLYKRYC